MLTVKARAMAVIARSPRANSNGICVLICEGHRVMQARRPTERFGYGVNR
jgi:hypothetical protein